MNMTKPVKPKLPKEEPKKRITVDHFSFSLNDSLSLKEGEDLLGCIVRHEDFAQIYPNSILSGEWRLDYISVDKRWDEYISDICFNFSGGALEYDNVNYKHEIARHKKQIKNHGHNLAKYHEDMKKYKEWKVGEEKRELEVIKKQIQILEKQKEQLEKEKL